MKLGWLSVVETCCYDNIDFTSCSIVMEYCTYSSKYVL